MNEDSKQIRILAVDDHPLLRQGIAEISFQLAEHVAEEALSRRKCAS